MKNETELQHEVDEAVRTLREGGLLLYPTTRCGASAATPPTPTP